MKLLGKLNAGSLMVGDLIEISGYISKIESISVTGVLVSIETDKIHPFKLYYLERIKVYSSFSA